MLRRVLRTFLREESGQDLADYCLLTALVALVAVAILIKVSGGVQNLWTVANTSLANGNQTATSSTAGSTAGSTNSN
jgi:Flp pilus assembly pilin Flp